MIDKHLWSATVAGAAVAIKGGSVTMDEAWSPYIQATLTVPRTAAVLALDPRAGDTRVPIVATQAFGDWALTSDLTKSFGGPITAALTAAWSGRDTSAISTDPRRSWNPAFIEATAFELNLGVRTTVWNRDGTVDLILSSDEALMQDRKLMASPSTSYLQTTIRALIVGIFEQLNAPGAAGQHRFTLADYPVYAPVAADGPANPAALVHLPGQSYWDFLTPHLQAANLRLFADDSGLFHLVTRGAATGGFVALQSGVNVVSHPRTRSRDEEDWADAVVINYAWTDGAGVEQAAADIATAGPVVTKTLALSYTTPPPYLPGYGFSRPALIVLSRANVVGETMQITAIAGYGITTRPPAICDLLLDDPDTLVRGAKATSITWSYPTAEMTLKATGLSSIGG